MSFDKTGERWKEKRRESRSTEPTDGNGVERTTRNQTGDGGEGQ